MKVAVRAKDVMFQGAASIRPEATVLEAASLMVNSRASALPVVDGENGLVGIVSEADVIPYVALGAASETPASGTHRVSDIMIKDVLSVDENASLKSTIEFMMGKHLKVVPVCRGRTVVGTLSRLEIMRLILSQVAQESSAITASLLPGNALSPEETLRNNVLAAVKGHRWSMAQWFDVVVQDGAVHLWGVVPTAEVHKAYCEAAEKVPQAKSVVSHMHVMPHHVRWSSTA